MKLSYIAILFGMVSLLAVMARASTFRDEAYPNRSTVTRATSFISVRGQLIYSEDGVLRIQEKGTGRTFRLTEDDADDSNLMQMYNAGQRDVAVEGTLRGQETIAVRTAAN